MESKVLDVLAAEASFASDDAESKGAEQSGEDDPDGKYGDTAVAAPATDGTAAPRTFERVPLPAPVALRPLHTHGYWTNRSSTLQDGVAPA